MLSKLSQVSEYKVELKRRRVSLTREMINLEVNPYVNLLKEDFAIWAFDEEKSLTFKGQWREKAFRTTSEKPMDLEIGTGNGYHFEKLARENEGKRLTLGMELKYKPLIQTIRRTVRAGLKDARMFRYDASYLPDIFDAGELNNIYIHFPDPWPKIRHHKNRLIQDEFLKETFELQRPGSFIEFKTDSLPYFEWAIEIFRRGPYKLTAESRDLHQSEWQSQNFVTQFESLFMKQGLKINFARLEKI
jgi:tRNA (guanine-N7-)-methyltransferase